MSVRRAVVGAAAAAFALHFFSEAWASPFQYETKRERLRKERAALVGAPKSDASRAEISSQQLYERIYEHFLKAQYAEVVEASAHYLNQEPAGEQADDIRHLEALSLYRIGRKEEAREKLRALEEKAHGPKRSEALISLADSYYYDGDIESARRSYTELVEKFADLPQAAYVRQRLTEPAMAERGAPTALGQAAVEEAPLFSVQVGSFTRAGNAERLLERLKRGGYEAYLKSEERGRYTRVRVGRFDSHDKASETESRLKREGFPAKVV